MINFFKNLIKVVLVLVLVLVLFTLWDVYSSSPTTSFCDSIENTDSYEVIKKKSKLKKYRVSELKQNGEVWIFTQPEKSGMYQEGLACVITIQKGKVVEKDIRAY